MLEYSCYLSVFHVFYQSQISCVYSLHVAYGKMKDNVNVYDQFLTLLLPDIEYDTNNQDAMETIYEEILWKLCNIRIQEFLSATKQDLVAKKV